MKKVILILMAFLVLSMVLVSAQEAVRNKAASNILRAKARSAVNENIDLDTLAPRVKKCVEFMQENTKVKRPLAVCNNILKQEHRCVELARNSGVEHPLKLCDTVIKAKAKVIKKVIETKKVRSILANKVVGEAKELRLKHLEGFINKHPNAEDFIKGLPEDEAKKFLEMPAYEQNKLVKSGVNKAITRLGKIKIKKGTAAALFKKRVIAKEKLKKAKDRFLAAKKKFVEANKKFNARKKLFLGVKAELKACEGQDTDECNELREKADEHAKEYLINSIDMIIQHLTKVKEQAEGSETLSEERVAEIIEKTDNAIKDLEAIKEEIEQAETKEEIIAVAKKINTKWKGIKNHAVRFGAKIIHAKVGEIIKRSENLQRKLDCTLTSMKEQEIEVENIESKIEQFGGKIDAGKDKFKEAEEIFTQIRESGGDAVLAGQAKSLVKEAHNELKQAHIILKDITKSIRDNGATITSCGDDDDIEIVEEESETEEGDEE